MGFVRVAAVGVLVSIGVVGQAMGQGRHRVGVLAGANFATLGGADVDGADTKVGFLFGGVASLGVSKNVAIETGLRYVQRGAKDEEAGITAKIKLNYIEVPAIVTARFPGANGVTPFIGAGASASFKAGCSISVSGSGGSVGTGCSAVEDALDIGLKGADFGLVAQAGVDVRQLRIAAGYYLGLPTLDNVSPSYSIKNRSFNLHVGYLVPVGRK